MNFDKALVLAHIRREAGSDQADKAAQVLPDRVDQDQHADLLRQHGVDPQNMANQLRSVGRFGADTGDPDDVTERSAGRFGGDTGDPSDRTRGSAGKFGGDVEEEP